MLQVPSSHAQIFKFSLRLIQATKTLASPAQNSEENIRMTEKGLKMNGKL